MSDLGEWEHWARNAYAAYGDQTGGLTHDARAMPTWEDLGEPIQQAWCAAARAARGED